MFAQMRRDSLDGIGCGDVECQGSAADSSRGVGQRVGCLLDIDRDNPGTIAGEYLSDRGTDPPGRTGDDSHLPGQWCGPVGGCGGLGDTDPEHLAVDIGGLGGEDESHRRFASGGTRVGARRNIDQCDGRSALHFFGQGAGESLKCSLRDAFTGVVHLIGRAAQDDETSRWPEVAQQWGEELEQTPQAGRVGDAGRVEDQTGEGVRPAATEVVAHDVVVSVECDAQRFGQPAFPADQQRTRQRWIAGPVAAQSLRCRQAELLGQERPRRRRDHL